MTKNLDTLRNKAHAGFSLVDVMVGMVIALLGMIIIFQVFSVSEGIKRTTISGGEASQSGAMALLALSQLLKSAGYGIFPSNGGDRPSDPVQNKILITPGAANESDKFTVTFRQYWTNGSFSPPAASGVPAFAPMVPPALTLETISVDPLTAQLKFDLLLDNPPYPSLPSDVAAAAAGAPPPQTTGVIAEGIALMKAEYGLDTTIPPDGAVDVWTQVTPANPASVVAVRIVLVARSAQPEKPSVAGGACDTTTVALAPKWIGSTVVAVTHPVAVPLDLSGNAGLAPTDSWQCYRYKTFENTVTLRN
jgi:type IV pilus assembly protein PilW